MSWRFVNAASRGTSHDATGTPCQDDCYVDVVASHCGEEILIATVADGAGSASRSEVGSGIACAALITSMTETLRDRGVADVDRSVVASWLRDAVAEIGARAAHDALVPRDFACTILGCAIGSAAAVFFQIGDGAIVIDDGGGLRPVFWPDSGEYANMTRFLTDGDFDDHLMFRAVEGGIDEVALFSDGLQRLALVFAERAAHAPFFEPMLQRLRAEPAGAAEPLLFPLLRFLASDAVNARTDDDKSLVLATRRT